MITKDVVGNRLCPICKTPLNIANIVDTFKNKNKNNKWDNKTGGIINSLYEPPVDCATSHLVNEHNEIIYTDHTALPKPVKYNNRSARKISPAKRQKKDRKKDQEKDQKNYQKIRHIKDIRHINQ